MCVFANLSNDRDKFFGDKEVTINGSGCNNFSTAKGKSVFLSWDIMWGLLTAVVCCFVLLTVDWPWGEERRGGERGWAKVLRSLNLVVFVRGVVLNVSGKARSRIRLIFKTWSVSHFVLYSSHWSLTSSHSIRTHPSKLMKICLKLKLPDDVWYAYSSYSVVS